MTYTAPTEKSFRERAGSLSKKICTELALLETEVLAAEVADAGTTSNTFTVDSDSTTGKIVLDVTLNSGQDRTMTITNQAMTADVTVTLPNATGTLATLAGSEALTNKSLALAGAPLIAVTGTPAFTFGNLDAAYASTKTANLIPVQVSVTQGADIGSGNTVGATYAKTTTGIAQTGQLATSMVRTTVGHNVFDAYGLQSHLTVAASMATVGDNAHLTAISGKVSFTGTPTVTKGWVTAGLFIIEGTGTCSQMCHGVSIVEEAGSTGAQSLLHLNSDATAGAAAFSFAGTSAEANMIYEATDTHQTYVGSIRIIVNGTTRYLHYSDDHAATS